MYSFLYKSIRFSRLLHSVDTLNKDQMSFAVDTTKYLLENIYDLATKQEFKAIIQIIKDMKPISIRMAYFSSKCLSASQNDETYIFRVSMIQLPNLTHFQLYGYLSLFDQLLESCIREDEQTDALNSSDILESSIKKAHGKIYAISNRIGTFLPQNEGHIFETDQAVRLFARVAKSIDTFLDTNTSRY